MSGGGTNNQERRGDENNTLSTSLKLQDPPSSEIYFDLPLPQNVEREKDISFEKKLEGALYTKKTLALDDDDVIRIEKPR
ncbi:hypothetical protein V6N12_034896 [Hibiscus sabdariffa]|uniref:Uncharacterized protein n=1 Tax=Hibiscus sabdariffa TaxID=183260 RepID=A0ABR2BP82_9ROSI